MGAWQHFLNPKRMSDLLETTTNDLEQARTEAGRLSRLLSKMEKELDEKNKENLRLHDDIDKIIAERPEKEQIEELFAKWGKTKRKLEERIETLEIQLEDARESLRLLSVKDEFREIEIDETALPAAPILPTEEEIAEERRRTDERQIEQEAEKEVEKEMEGHRQSAKSAEETDWLKLL